MDKDKQAAFIQRDFERALARNPDLQISRDLARTAIEKGDYIEATARYELIAQTALDSKDIATLVETKLRLAGVKHKLGNDDAAYALMADALAINEQHGNPFDIHAFLNNPAEW